MSPSRPARARSPPTRPSRTASRPASDPSMAIGQADDPQTSAGRAAPGAYRSSVDEKFTFDTRAWQKAIGLYLLGHARQRRRDRRRPVYPRAHPGRSTVPYLSMFSKKGDGTLIAVRDCKLSKLEFAWQDNQPLVVSVEADGCVLSFPADLHAGHRRVGHARLLHAGRRHVQVRRRFGGAGRWPRSPAARSPSPRTSTRRCSPERSRPATRSRATCQSTSRSTASRPTPRSGARSSRAPWAAPASRPCRSTAPSRCSFAKGADSLKLGAYNVGFLADLPGADAKGGAAQMTVAGSAYPAVAGRHAYHRHADQHRRVLLRRGP